MDRAPGRIGFMNTQRRVSRWQRTRCTERREALGRPGLTSAAQYGRAHANSGTAPPGIATWFYLSGRFLSPEAPAWLATNSLRTDHPIEQLVEQDGCCGSPPLCGSGRHATTCTPATLRSSLSHIPFLSGFARLHPTLPQGPAGRSRWTERYDGKRDLHFQHAA